ncbi:MAG: putative toxin-antitoxin system toxin component, PIN family [Acidobacteriota bacterium]
MTRPKVVLDTNIVVSAPLVAEGYERFVLDLALAGKLELYASEDILAEYQGVLKRPKFQLTKKQITRSMALIRERANLVDPKMRVGAASDPDDNKFLECAETARANYLVTGNKRHFPKEWANTKVVNGRELIRLIASDLEA